MPQNFWIVPTSYQESYLNSIVFGLVLCNKIRSKIYLYMHVSFIFIFLSIVRIHVSTNGFLWNWYTAITKIEFVRQQVCITHDMLLRPWQYIHWLKTLSIKCFILSLSPWESCNISITNISLYLCLSLFLFLILYWSQKDTTAIWFFFFCFF